MVFLSFHLGRKGTKTAAIMGLLRKKSDKNHFKIYKNLFCISF